MSGGGFRGGTTGREGRTPRTKRNSRRSRTGTYRTSDGRSRATRSLCPHSPQVYPQRCNYKSVIRRDSVLFSGGAGISRPGDPPPVDKPLRLWMNHKTVLQPKLFSDLSSDKVLFLQVRDPQGCGQLGVLQCRIRWNACGQPRGDGSCPQLVRVIHNCVPLSSTAPSSPRTGPIRGCPHVPHPLLLLLPIYWRSSRRKRGWGYSDAVTGTAGTRAPSHLRGCLAAVHPGGLLWDNRAEGVPCPGQGHIPARECRERRQPGCSNHVRMSDTMSDLQKGDDE